MPANIPLVSVPKLTCPAGLNITKLIASVPRDKIIIIAAIVLKIDPVSTDFCTCVCGRVICTPRARIAHFYLAWFCASVPGGGVPVITLIMAPVNAVPTNFIAKICLVVVTSKAFPSIFNFADVCASVSISVSKSRDVNFHWKVVVISNCWRTC